MKEYIQKRNADREWLLDILFFATSGNHEIFRKDYEPPKKMKFMKKVQNQKVDPKFIQGVPKSDAKTKRPTNFFADP